MYAVGLMYVHWLESGRLHGWLRKERDCELTEIEIEEAWWMLMLRGLAWSMSVHIICGRDVAPSHWRDATPVYFS